MEKVRTHLPFQGPVHGIQLFLLPNDNAMRGLGRCLAAHPVLAEVYDDDLGTPA